MTVKRAIDNFLAQKRIAIVGASRGQNDFSRGLLREMRDRGYDTVPVNPNATEIEGLPCFASVREVEPPVDGALIMLPDKDIDAVVKECVESGVTRIWLHGTGKRTGPSDEVEALCNEKGVALISGQCPYMFLTDTALIHRFHGKILKWMGKYPK